MNAVVFSPGDKHHVVADIAESINVGHCKNMRALGALLNQRLPYARIQTAPDGRVHIYLDNHLVLDVKP